MNTIYEDKELAAKLKEAMEAQKAVDVKAVEDVPVTPVQEPPAETHPQQAM